MEPQREGKRGTGRVSAREERGKASLPDFISKKSISIEFRALTLVLKTLQPYPQNQTSHPWKASNRLALCVFLRWKFTWITHCTHNVDANNLFSLMNLHFADSIYDFDTVLKPCHACLLQFGCHEPVVINWPKCFKTEFVIEQHVMEDGVNANSIQIRSVHAITVFHKQRKECTILVAFAQVSFGHAHMQSRAHTHNHTEQHWGRTQIWSRIRLIRLKHPSSWRTSEPVAFAHACMGAQIMKCEVRRSTCMRDTRDGKWYSDLVRITSVCDQYAHGTHSLAHIRP